MRDPAGAPKRTDLPYLRHRARPRPAAPVAAVTEFVSGRTPPPHHPPRHQPATQAPVSPPSPAPPPVTPSPARPLVSSSLDLDEPAPVATPAAAPVASAASAAAAPAPPAAPAPSPARSYPITRVRAGARTILTPKAPTVTLTRTQTGVGTLTFEAVCSEAVGDLELGAVYQLRDGVSATVQSAGGNRFAPPRSRLPVLVAGRDRYARLSVDLRQCGELERLAVFAYSPSRTPLTWGGTLITTTFGGARLELPLEELSGDIAVLLSLYNVHGEFVLRAEMQPIAGSVREASRAYGYDQITWLDDRTPVE